MLIETDRVFGFFNGFNGSLTLSLLCSRCFQYCSLVGFNALRMCRAAWDRFDIISYFWSYHSFWCYYFLWSYYLFLLLSLIFALITYFCSYHLFWSYYSCLILSLIYHLITHIWSYHLYLMSSFFLDLTGSTEIHLKLMAASRFEPWTLGYMCTLPLHHRADSKCQSNGYTWVF